MKKEIATTIFEGHKHLANALSNFEKFPICHKEESNQVFTFVLHGVSKNWRGIVNELYNSIDIEYANGFPKDYCDKAAMIAYLDYEGSRTQSYDATLSERKHIHGIIIFPKPKRTKTCEVLQEAINERIQDICEKLKVDRFTCKLSYYDISKYKSIFYTTSYHIKLISFSNNRAQAGDPVVIPYDRRIENINGKLKPLENYKNQTHQLMKDMYFEPLRYFDAELARMDTRHVDFLKQFNAFDWTWNKDAKQQMKDKAIECLMNNKFARLQKYEHQLQSYNPISTEKTFLNRIMDNNNKEFIYE